MDPHAPRLSDMDSGMREGAICLVILQVHYISLFTISCWNSVSFLDSDQSMPLRASLVMQGG